MTASIHLPTMSSQDVVRPTHVEVDLTRLADNYKAIQAHVGDAKMMPIVKANAYGHGLLETARLMEKLGADYIGVAVLEEALLLREHGIRTPILVLGGIFGNQVPYFIQHDITITVSSAEKLRYVDDIAGRMGTVAKVHLKIDTGMGRIGVQYYNAESTLETALGTKHLDIEGIFTHFANADSADLTHSRTQIARFQETLSFYQRHNAPPPRLRHMANSGGILQLPEATFDMVRPGVMLYGVYPSPEAMRTVEVRPALSWHSRVVYFKVIQPGHPVGYGSTWQSEVMTRAVTIPVGYGDGYFRGMSGQAQVLINGVKYPVVGRISMDQIVVDIGMDSAYSDDQVVLMGEMDSESISADDLATWAGTIPYEILTNINTRVPRIYKR
ncbi:MAG: alanine racemase [Chloroflexota bacterium]